MPTVTQASMAGTLRQTKPFRDSQQESYLALVRTAAELSYSLDLLLRPYGLTQPQYNVLRILRGAGSEGLGRNEIRDRMVTAMPDMSRLLERMEKQGWLTRERSDEDRRHVPSMLTKAGLGLVQKLDDPLAELHKRQFQGIAVTQVKALLTTLQAVRNNLA